MIRINVYEAKVHLSKYLAKLKPGETILVCRRNVPVAEIRLVRSGRRTSRPFGLERGTFEVPADFNAPLPDALLDAWEKGRV